MFQHGFSRAFTLIELLIVVAIIGVLSAIAVPNFLQARVRAQIARTNADMDAVAKAAMMFRMDYNRFPYATDDLGESYVAGRIDASEVGEFYTVQTYNLGVFTPHLTSPVSYISYAPIDPFSSQPELPYGYAGGKQGFIFTSFGPDRDQNEGVNDLFHRGDIDEPTSYLLGPGEENGYSLMSSFMGAKVRSSSPTRLRVYVKPRTYDTSNGLFSNGDIWRANF